MFKIGKLIHYCDTVILYSFIYILYLVIFYYLKYIGFNCIFYRSFIDVDVILID